MRQIGKISRDLLRSRIVTGKVTSIEIARRRRALNAATEAFAKNPTDEALEAINMAREALRAVGGLL